MTETSENHSSVADAPPPNFTGACDAPKHPQIPSIPYLTPLHGDVNKLPIMYPMLVPGLLSAQNPEEMNRGPGIYAVPVLPCMGPVTGVPMNTLIPLTYGTPTSIASEARVGSGEQSQVGQQHQQAQQLQPQRQIVVRRLQIAFHVDLLLILKLAAVIFIFNQDGSRQRLALLVFFASIVYLYQTGALSPLVRWLSRAMHRAAAPPQPPRPAARGELVIRQGDENAVGAAADGQAGGAENENQPANEDENAAIVEGGNQWWGIVKEIQMIVFGFITSLLPGFHNIDNA